MKYCNAFVQKHASQCKKYAIPGSGYCFIHQPKRELLLSTLIGVILGLFTTILFNDPITTFLSRFNLFHYLDKEQPSMSSLIPNIKKNNTIDRLNKKFILSFDDKGSGIDIQSGSITIEHKKNDKFIMVQGKLNRSDSTLVFLTNEELEYGEYFLKASIKDYADNQITFSQTFYVKVPHEIGFHLKSYEFEKYKGKHIFASFLESNPFENFNLYVYELNIHNKGYNSIISNLYLTLDVGIVVLQLKVYGSLHAKGITSYSSSELSPHMKNRLYLSQRFLNIEELAPHGIIFFALLVGENRKLPILKKNAPKSLYVSGTYISEGIGKTETRQIDFQKISANNE